MSGNDATLTYGSFSFQTIICELFQTEIGRISDKNASEAKTRASLANRSFLVRAALSSKGAQDAFNLSLLDPQLLKQAQDTLFHERMHYWQLLSCSSVQRQFTAFLLHIRHKLRHAGGEPDFISGNILYDSLADVSAVAQHCEANFAPSGLVNKGKLHKLFDYRD